MKVKYARLIVSLMIFISFASVVAFSETNGTINVTTTVIGLYGYIKAPNNKYPCSSNADCYSNNCAADYTGSKYCADTNVCVHRLSGDTLATNYENGDYGPDCKDSTHNWKCDNGVWVAHACSSGYECKNGNCVKKENSTQQSQYTNEMWVCKNSTHKAFMNYKGELTNITFCPNGCKDGKCVAGSGGSNEQSNAVSNMTFYNLTPWVATERIEKEFYVSIKNNGDLDLSSVKLNVSGCSCKVTPTILQIPKGSVRKFLVYVNETKFGKKSVTLTAYNGSLTITKSITLTVEPNNESMDEINKTLQNVSMEVAELMNVIQKKKKSGYDVKFAEINVENLEKNINTTKELIEKGDYISAYNLLSDMKSSIQRTKNIINAAQRTKSSHGWVWFVVIFILVGVVMTGVYIFWPQEHGYKKGVGYIPKSEEGGIRAFFRDLVDKYKRWRMMKKLEKEEKKFKYRYKA